MNTVDTMRNKKHFCCIGPVSEEDVKEAQGMLGCPFADDYREYVKEFGIASFDGHELTGICPSKRLNVVEVTIKARKRQPALAKDWYVIEELNVDDVIICQDASGSICEVVLGSKSCQIASSLKEYVEL